MANRMTGGFLRDEDTNALVVAGGVALDTTKGVVIDVGSGYPARPTGYLSVEWIGPSDPDDLAEDYDSWVPTV